MDELVCQCLVSPVSLYMTNKLEAFQMVRIDDEEDDSEQDAYDKHQRDKQWTICSLSLWCFIIPHRLIHILAVTTFFVGKYYFEFCTHTEDGSWVSIPVRLPRSEALDIWTFLFSPIPGMSHVRSVASKVWQMP